jgi:PAS domain S-box-containing protein
MTSGRQLRILLVGVGAHREQVLDRLSAHAVDAVPSLEAESAVDPGRADCVVVAAGDRTRVETALDASAAGDLPVVVLLVPDADLSPGDVLSLGAADALSFDDPASLRRLADRVASAVAWRERQDDARERLTEALKERAMDEAPVGITIADNSLPDRPLVYVNDAFETMTGYSRGASLGRNCRYLQGPGSDPQTVAELRRAIQDERPTSVELVNYRRDGSRFWNKVDVAPVRDAAGRVTHFVGFQTDVTDRVRAEAAAERYAAMVERERSKLQTLVDRVEGLLVDVTRVLVAAEDRAELEREVCDRVAETEGYAAVWVGDSDLTPDEIVPRVWAGSDAADVAGLRIDRSDPDDPTARAVATGSIQVLADPDGRFHAGTSLPHGAVAAVPLVHRERVYGVLSVYAANFADHERAVLQTLGRAVGAAIDAFETRRSLATDSPIELEFTLWDPALGPVATAGDCRLSYEGAVFREDGGVQLYVSATPADAPIADATAPGLADVTPLPPVDESGLFELRLDPESILGRLPSVGGRLLELVVDDQSSRMVVTVPDRTAGRSLLDAVETTGRRVDLRAVRGGSRPLSTSRTRGAIAGELTDRQRTALQLAFLGGFFEWPHATSGDELAEAMGISRSTFHQHLRAAERKLVAQFFEHASG